MLADRILLIVPLVALAAAGQVTSTIVSGVGPGSPSNPQEPALKDEDYCTVEGVVVDARTQAPLRKAFIVLWGGRDGGRGGVAGTTDAAGRFVIDKVPPGRYQVSVQRNGYAMSVSGSGNPSSLTLSRGERVKGIVFKLQPAAAITGRVVDEDGEPLAYAQVTVMRYRYVRGKRQLAPSGGGGMTNDRGEYRIFGLPPGRYYVSASYQGRMLGLPPLARGRPQSGVSYPTMYYPGALDPEQAVAIRLGAGEERSGIDFRLSPVQAVNLSGRVVAAATGKPLADVAVTLVPRTEGPSPLVSRQFQRADTATGKFTIPNVRPGSYVLAAWHRDGDSQLYARQEIEVAASDIENVELVLMPAATIAGRVTVEPGGGALKFDEARVYLEPQQEDLRFGGFGDGRIKEDGTFEIRNLAPGRYSVRLYRLPEGCYLKAARMGDQEVLSSGLTIQPGSSGVLDLLVSPAGGQVDGVVLDSEKKPHPGAAVVLIPDEKRRHRDDLYFQQSSDQNGRFSFRGVPPGEYKVFAWDKIEFDVYRDPAFLERFEDEGAKVVVKERSAVAAETKLLHAEEAEQ